MGIGAGLGGLRALATATGQAALEAGVRADDRAGGRPHLTLARASTARGAPRGMPNRGGTRRRVEDLAPLTSWARALAVYRGPAWEVDAVRVVASELGAGRSGGPLHTDVAEVPLGIAPSCSPPRAGRGAGTPGSGR